MEPSKEDYCSICWEILSDSKSATKAIDILEILKFLLIDTNHKLLQESIICENCLKKVQSAYKFKILYPKNIQQTLDNVMVKEETNSENFTCEICKKILDPSDSIPFVESDRSTLMKHFSIEFASKVSENLRTCEKCHKSLLNFCTITNSITIFEQNSVVINDLGDVEKRNDTDYSVFQVDIKEERDIDGLLQNVKEEINRTVQDVKEEHEDDSTYNEFVLKNEEVDLKCDRDSKDDTVTVNSDGSSRKNNLTLASDYNLKIYWKRETQKMSSPGNHSFELNETNIDLGKNHADSARNSSFQANRTDSLVYKGIDEIENIFQCSDCEYRTKYKKYLKRHALVHSNDGEMFQCEVCNHQTRHKNSLKKHMLTHKSDDDVEMFRCNVCNYQSKQKGNLKRHVLIHSNDVKMFRCNICKFQTKHQNGLKGHMLTHKNNNEIEMFQCYNCNFQSKHKSCLKTHMLRHRNETEIEFFQCHICEYQTKRRHNLKRHMLVHKSIDEIEMFQCNICNYQSKHKRSFTRHMLIHKKCSS